METGPSIPAGAVRLQLVAVQTVALVAAHGVHAAVFTGTRLQAALVQVLVTGFSRESWLTPAFVRSHTFTVFTAVRTVRLTAAPV